MLTDSTLDRYSTKGQGDCAFHAAFGEWDVSQKQFVCKSIVKIRAKVCDSIRKCQPGTPVYQAVKEAIQQIIMVENKGGREFKSLKIAYNVHLAANSYSIDLLWKAFEDNLVEFPDVVKYIDECTPQNKRHLSLKTRFSDALTKNDEVLYGIIFSVPKLQKAFEHYNQETRKNFSWDEHLKNKDLIEEYAILMAQAAELHCSGYWLLPGELEIVARALNTSIDLYITKLDTKEKIKIETYNPGQGMTTSIYFNGNNHYEKMTAANFNKSLGNPSGSTIAPTLSAINPVPSVVDSDSGLISHEVARLARNNSSPFAGFGEYGASGLKKAFHGNVYQLKLLMLFLKRGFEKKYKFQLATEVDAAEKFDDVVFQFAAPEKGGKKSPWIYRYLQAKHRFDESLKITEHDLLTDKDEDFSLQKYFQSYQKIKKRVMDGVFQDFIICTNINFDFSGDGKPGRKLKLQEVFEEIKDKDDIFNISGKKPAKRYRFKAKFQGKEKLFEVFKKTDLLKLVEKLFECISHNKPLDLKGAIFKLYHVALAKEVIDVKSKKIKRSFIEEPDKLSESVRNFRRELFGKIKSAKKFKGDAGAIDLEVQKFLKETDLKVSATFGQVSSDEMEGVSEKLPEINNVKDEEIEEFLKLLVFAVDQPNEIELEDVISKELGEQFNLIDSELVVSYFHKEMLDWLKAKKGTYLGFDNARDFFKVAGQKIDQLILIGATLEFRAMVERLKVGFKDNLSLSGFLNGNSQLLHFVSPIATKFSSIKVYQALRKIKDLKKEGSYIFVNIQTCYNLRVKLCNAFEQPSANLLVIECNQRIPLEDYNEIFKSLAKVLKKFPEKKIILIGENDEYLVKLLRDELTGELELDSDSGFEGLSSESQAVYRDKTVLFQGNKVTLSELIGADHIPKIITPNAMFEFINTGNVVIDLKPTGLNSFETHCYVPRTLLRNRALSLKVLQTNVTDMFVLVNVAEEKLIKIIGKGKYRKSNVPDENKDEPASYILSSSEDAEESFKEQVKNYPKRNIHCLEFSKKFFIWLQSYGSLQGLRNHCTSDSAEKCEAQQINNKIAIISAIPGMGKSTTLSHLVQKQKEENPDLWVFKIDLKEKKKIIDTIDFRSIKDAVDFIISARQLDNQSLCALSENILLFLLTNVPEKVVIFIDGFDEISSEHQVKIIQFVQVLQKKSTVKKLIVATRQHMQESLEDALGVFSYDLQPLSEEDQLNYLKKYWEAKLEFKITGKSKLTKFKSFSEKLLALFKVSIKDTVSEFMGVPLQARLLAEAFEEDFKRFFNGVSDEVQLPDELDIVDLYRRFKLQKYLIYFNEKIELDGALPENHKDVLSRSLTKAHQWLAFNFLFPEHTKQFFQGKQFPLSMEDLKLVGIIYIKEDGLVFVHRTFSEYFVADLMFELLKKKILDQKFKQAKDFLLKNIFKARNKVIFHFLSEMTHKENNAELTKKWSEICKADVFSGNFKGSSEPKQTGGIHVSTYYEPEEPDENAPEPLSKNFEDHLQWLRDLLNRRVVDRDFAILSSCFVDYLKVTNLLYLEQALQILADLAGQHKLNNLKLKILEQADMLIKHYISELLAQNKISALSKKHKLLANFATVKSNTYTTAYGLSSAKSVDEQVDFYKAKLAVYHKLQQLLVDKSFQNQFWKELTAEKIFYLRITNKTLDSKGIKKLQEFYPDWHDSKDFGGMFKELFLQIDAGNITDVAAIKNFLIEKNEHKHLIQFLIKFKGVSLLAKDVAKIYKAKGLFWLERTGIEIATKLNLLTLGMFEHFSEILNDAAVNGYHTNYALNILNGLILYFIDLSNSKLGAVVNKFVLVQMFACFVEFLSRHEISATLNSKQLKSVFGIIEKVFNDPLLTAERLASNIKFLISIANALKLKPIKLEGELLMIDPNSDFSFELSLKHNNIITDLLIFKIQNPEDDLGLKCSAAMNTIVAATREDKFTPSFNQRLVAYSANGPSVEADTNPRLRRSLSFNFLL